MVVEIQIDSEFKSLIPPLSADEYALLEASIQVDGCRDALIVWKGENILVDGHNRYEICQKHNIPYGTIEREFDSREDVIIWMVNNQLARRNITSFVRAELALRMKGAIAAKGEQGKRSDLEQNFVQSSEPNRTNREIAKAADVSHETIRKVEKVSETAPEQIKAAARAGEISVDRAYRFTKAIEDAPQVVIDAALKYAADEPEKADILKRLHKSGQTGETNGTFDEIVATGGFHYGDDMAEHIDFASAPIEQIRKALDTIVEYHRKLALEHRRDEKIGKLREQAWLTGKYNIVYADPPWQYEHIKTENRAIENQYPTMAIDTICKLPVPTITADDAVLFLWATSPKLAEAMQVLTAWGFTYRTCMVWVKDKIGMGYYVRQQHELLLICTRGTLPVPEPSDRLSSVVNAPRGKHSEKPEAFYEIIERMYPAYQKVEIFSRNQREGWSGWGNEYEHAA